MTTGLRLEQDGSVALCGNSICCPTLKKISENQYELTDDLGNKVLLTKEQALLINPAIVECDKGPVIKEQLICG